MKNLYVVAVAVLLSSCGNEVGRYQLVVTDPFEGESKMWRPVYSVCDTKTGKVYIGNVNGKQETWDPVSLTLTTNTLTKTENTKK